MNQTPIPAVSGWWRRIRMTLDMIRFEHSVFALPFALTGALLAWRDTGFPAPALAAKLAWILLAMAGARSAAMTFNRIVDASLDARNSRTRMRHLPAGLLSRTFAWGFLLAAAAVFFVAAGMLNRTCLYLSPVALAIVLAYSCTKRFTALAHLALGFALGIAPAAAWIAMTGALDARILWLTAAVTLWSAGFDIIYACQDYDFDRREGLRSIPARLGVAGALRVARLLHAAMFFCLVGLAFAFKMRAAGLGSAVLVGGLLAYEHSLVAPDDLSRVDAAFFTVNGWVGVLFFACWALPILQEFSSR